MRLEYELFFKVNAVSSQDLTDLATYDTDIFQGYLQDSYGRIEKAVIDELEKENLNGAIITFEEQLKKAYKISKKKVRKNEQPEIKKMEEANMNFNKLQQCLNGDIAGDTAEFLEAYQKSRKEVSIEILTKEQDDTYACMRRLCTNQAYSLLFIRTYQKLGVVLVYPYHLFHMVKKKTFGLWKVVENNVEMD